MWLCVYVLYVVVWLCGYEFMCLCGGVHVHVHDCVYVDCVREPVWCTCVCTGAIACACVYVYVRARLCVCVCVLRVAA